MQTDARLESLLSSLRTVTDDSFDALTILSGEIDESVTPMHLTLHVDLNDMVDTVTCSWSGTVDGLAEHSEHRAKLERVFLATLEDFVDSFGGDEAWD